MRQLLDEKKAASLLGLRPKTLCRWRWEGRGPNYLKIEGVIRYDPVDLIEFTQSKRVENNG